MNLPTPALDDRSFQQLVDEAKTHIAQRCPQWTNHNVSDPGVALIEAFAWMTDQLSYRLNRVPDVNYVKFLELVGVQLFPPSAAEVEVSFRLSSHQNVPVEIPAGTRVCTRRSAGMASVEFTTTAELRIPPAVSGAIVTSRHDQTVVDRSEELAQRRAFEVFSHEPVDGDAIYVALNEPAPSCIVLVQFVCQVAGHGIDPARPPLHWEAWTLDGWKECVLERDTTYGLNAPGGMDIHVPRGHAVSRFAGREGAWIRCVVASTIDNRRSYRTSPVVTSLTAATIGGNAMARNSVTVMGEVLGTSDGTAGQRFTVSQAPVLQADGPLVIHVGIPRRSDDQAVTPPGPGTDDAASDAFDWQEWTEVDSFANSGPESRHFVLEPTTGEIRFGPRVRARDGSQVAYGAAPAKLATIRVPLYRTGGGATGNVAPRAINVLRSSIPYVASVYNRLGALGGADGETVEEAKVRGPMSMRVRNRAVTAEDFEQLTMQAAPALARARCVAADGGARILVVPKVLEPDGLIPIASLVPPREALERALAVLERSRTVGMRLSVEPPSYVGIRVDARVRARAEVDANALGEACVQALSTYFNPLVGGPDRSGWPFGRPAQVREVDGVLARVRGVDFVEDALMFRANPITKETSESQDRIDLDPTSVLLSVEHFVEVVER